MSFKIVNNGTASSSMTVLEMPSYPQEIKSVLPSSSRRSSGDSKIAATESSPRTVPNTLPAPSTATIAPKLQRWNSSKLNVFRVLTTFYSFIILGMNDAAYGALIPYLQDFYHKDYTVISLVFLSPVAGYTASALLNNRIHNLYGQRGVAILLSTSHVIAYTVIAIHPPYPVLVVIFMFAGFGNGVADSAWNAWIGDMANPNEVLGFLHAFYGLGATISPLVATSLVTKAHWPWYTFYYFMIGAAVIEVMVLVTAFWKEDGVAYRASHAETHIESRSNSPTELSSSTEGPQRLGVLHTISAPVKVPWYQRFNPFHNPTSDTAIALKNKVTILAALFLLFYVGAEVSIGGWIVDFMLRVRHGSPFASGLVSTGFWLGVTIGRLVLGFVTARVFPTEKHAVATYLVLCVGLQLLFWLIPSFTVSAVMVGLLGFFLAPMFPAAIVAITKLLPKRLHVAAVGFAAAVGASGATILPFAVGAIANEKGVKVLQPVILALLAAILLLWLLIPRLPKQRMN